MYGRTFFIALGLVGAVGTAAVYGIGGNLVITGAIELGTLVAMAAFVTQIYNPLTSLTNARVDIMTAFVSFDRVFEILDLTNAIVDRPGAVDLIDPTGRIEIDDVWFRYPAASVVSLASLEADGGAAAVRPGRRAGAQGHLRRHRARASWWPWSGRPAPARPPSARSSPGSTT